MVRNQRLATQEDITGGTREKVVLQDPRSQRIYLAGAAGTEYVKPQLEMPLEAKRGEETVASSPLSPNFLS